MRKPLPRPNIVKVYEHYDLRIEGPDRGGWVKAQCPLPGHEDQNPSASINEELGKFHCHACSESGDGLDIIQRRDGVGLVGAASLAAQFVDGDGSEVRAGAGSSGLLPGRQGSKPGRRNWSPPWKGL